MLRSPFTDITQETNQTRRYFETKFSQYLLGETGKPEIVASIDKISRSLINLGASDPRSAEERIAAIAESGGEDVILRHMQLKQGSEKYATKDRIMREGFLSREEESMEGEVSQEETWSRNLGVMRGTDPNFRDEIAEGNIRNRVPDVNRAREGSSSDYSQRDNRHRSAYTSSISGHTFATVAVLEEYMIRSAEAGESSEELDKDINNFLAAYIGTYAKRGYHSMHEVLDVLREPNIQRVFAKYGVNVNPPIYGESLANAMNDSASYSQRICQKSSMHAEISGMSRTSAANKAQRLLTLNKEKNKLIDAIHNDEKLSEKEREALSRKIEACPSYVALQSMKMGIIQGHLSARKDHDSLGFDNTDILSTDSGFSFKDVYKRNSNSSFWKRFTTDTDKRERQLEGLDSSLKELVDASPETRDAKLKEFYDKVQSTLLEVKGENNFSKSRLGDICEALIYSLEKTNPELCQESPESKRRTSLRD